MSRFTGKQHKGAMALYREEKRREAKERNRRANARPWKCAHVSSSANHPCEVTR
jgi:hypothetical protein